MFKIKLRQLFTQPHTKPTTTVFLTVFLLLAILGVGLVSPFQSTSIIGVQTTHAQEENQDSNEQAEDNKSCEAQGAAMGWILCPSVSLIDGTVNFLDTQIQRLLEVDEGKYNNIELKLAWSQFRNIAYIVLIPVMLVMVIGTALGFEIFSAYTVKKALPRMVFAIIFITLSWYICQFLIGFTNVIGYGVGGLVTRPFVATMPEACRELNSDGEAKGLTLSCLFSTNTNAVNTPDSLPGNELADTAINYTTGIFLGIIQSAVIGVGVIALVIFFGFTILLAIGSAFLILLLRQLIIIALILVAPLAILSWIFPGNDKMWKFWWGTFTKLLLMFPLIMLLLAVGKVFAVIVYNSPEGGAAGTFLNPTFKILAYTLPFAFIPFTFRFAGGMFATLAGFVNDKEKGLFDHQKRKRAERAQRWGKDIQSGQFGNNYGKAGRLAARGLRRVSAPTSMIPGKFGNKGRGKIIAATQANAAAQEAEKDIMANNPIDDRMWNEFAQHGHSAAALSARVKTLRSKGEHELAAKLQTMSSHAGDRAYGIAAMNAASKSGKLEDSSAEALDKWYGDDRVEREAKAKVAGDLAYNMKSAGNFAGVAIGTNEETGKIETYSTMTAEGRKEEADQKIFNKMAEAGPQAWGSMPGYETSVPKLDASGNAVRDASGKIVYEKKSVKAIALDAAASATGGDPSVKMAAIEKIASEAAPGAYTDPRTASFAREQMDKLKKDTSGDVALTVGPDGKTTEMPLIMGDDGKPIKILDVGGGRGVKEGSPAYMAYMAERRTSTRMRPEDIDAMNS